MVVNCRDLDGRLSTPLHFASGYNRIAVVEYLIQNGANVHAKDKGGLVALHNACSYGHYEVSRLLVEHGANVNMKDLWNYTPLHEAAAKGKYDICKLLLENCADKCIQNRFVCLFICLFVCLFVLFVCLFCLFVCFVCLFVCLFVLMVYLFVYLFICMLHYIRYCCALFRDINTANYNQTTSDSTQKHIYSHFVFSNQSLHAFSLISSFLMFGRGFTECYISVFAPVLSRVSG